MPKLILLILALVLLAAAPAQALIPGIQTPGELAPEHEANFGSVATQSRAPMVRWQISSPSAKNIRRVLALNARGDGTRVLAVLMETPWWGNRAITEADVDRYRESVRRNVAALAPLGVHHYEVWNEPDLPQFWPGPRSGWRYARFLRAAYPVIKQIDPQAVVISAGVTNNNHAFVRQMYAAGAGPSLDAVGTHVYPQGRAQDCSAYASTRRAQLCGVTLIRDVMRAYGDGHKPVWLTEFGRWACAKSPTSGCVDGATQARFVTEGYAYLRRFGFLRAGFWFSDYDYGADRRAYGLRGDGLWKRSGFYHFRREAVNWRTQAGW